MNSKVFSRLMQQRIQPSNKFPQLRLSARADAAVHARRPFRVGFDLFDSTSLDFISREVGGGRIVEVRESNKDLLALGFFEPVAHAVDIFEWSPRVIQSLPTIDEEFFIGRVEAAVARRLQSLPPNTNTFRAVHGAEDGLPCLFIDQYSDRFYSIKADSYGSNRLLPPVAEFLRRRGAEEFVVESPTIKKQRITVSRPTIELPCRCLENGVTLEWVCGAPITDPLMCCAYRRSRVLLREISKGKRVLCVHDIGGMAALNAVMSASKVALASDDETLLGSARRNLLYNHGEDVFKICETVEASPLLSGISSFKFPFDIVFLEHHPVHLSSARQWRELLHCLIQNKMIVSGTVVASCHESSPETGFSGIKSLFNDVFKKNELQCQLVRSFGSSIDYPKTASTRYTSHFSHFHLVE